MTTIFIKKSLLERFTMTLTEILLIILIIIFGSIAFKFKFNVNDYLRDRREIKKDQLKNVCPHIRITNIQGKEIQVQSMFNTSYGTFIWMCSQCGLIVNSEDEVNRIMNNYEKDPSKIAEQQEKYYKKAKKLKIM